MQPEDGKSLEIVLRLEIVPFQSSETWLNFLSPFPSYNAAPDLRGYVTWGERKKSHLTWFIQENWKEIEMIPQSGVILQVQ